MKPRPEHSPAGDTPAHENAPLRHCPGCRTVGYEEDIYCSRCGRRFGPNCGRCGAAIDHPVAIYCARCGAKINDDKNTPGSAHH